MEIGYCNTFKDGVKGSFKALTRQKISQLRSIMSPTCRLIVMVDWNDVAFDVLDPPNQDLDLIRVVFYKKDLQGAILTAERLMTLGYDVSMNFMVCSMYSHEEFRAALRQCRASTIYNDDSFGCMMPDEIKKYADIGHEASKICGVHLHNNCQMAVASYVHLKERVDLIDASVFGMGRGAGNLPLEICLCNDDDLLEVLIFIEEYVKPLFSMTYNTWGYDTDYFYASRMFCHPSYVSKMRESGIPAVTRLVVLRDLRKSVSFDQTLLASTMQARAIECFALGDDDSSAAT
jgi:4-hydroxy 2-oxovalerate aldolase